MDDTDEKASVISVSSVANFLSFCGSVHRDEPDAELRKRKALYVQKTGLLISKPQVSRMSRMKMFCEICVIRVICGQFPYGPVHCDEPDAEPKRRKSRFSFLKRLCYSVVCEQRNLAAVTAPLQLSLLLRLLCRSFCGFFV